MQRSVYEEGDVVTPAGHLLICPTNWKHFLMHIGVLTHEGQVKEGTQEVNRKVTMVVLEVFPDGILRVQPQHKGAKTAYLGPRLVQLVTT